MVEYYKNVEKKDGRVLRTGGPRDIQRKQRMDRDNNQLIDILKEQISNLQNQINNSPPTTGFSAEQVDHEIRAAVKEAVEETVARYEGLLKKANEKVDAATKRFNNIEAVKNEQLNKEMEILRNKFIEKEHELGERYNNKISELEDRLKIAEEKIVVKDELLEALRAEKDSAIKNLIEEQTKKMEELTRSMAYNQGQLEEESDRPKMEDVFIDPLEEGAGDGLVPHIDIEDVSTKEKDAMKDKVDKLRSIMGTRGK